LIGVGIGVGTGTRKLGIFGEADEERKIMRRGKGEEEDWCGGLRFGKDEDVD
jgi:hypothetical protein